MQDCRRGYLLSDEKEFSLESQQLLRKAQKDLLYLLEQGYKVKGASTFVGNHYMLSERQRLAIVRATEKESLLIPRKKRCLSYKDSVNEVSIDGLNIVITLEVALSDGTLIHCMDGSIRDLAGLRGTYRLINQTDIAIRYLGEELMKRNIDKVTIYLDAPVSNTGRLKQRIYELFAGHSFHTDVVLVDNPDTVLKREKNVITQDSIILDQCESWINIVPDILQARLPYLKYVELGDAIGQANS